MTAKMHRRSQKDTKARTALPHDANEEGSFTTRDIFIYNDYGTRTFKLENAPELSPNYEFAKINLKSL